MVVFKLFGNLVAHPTGGAVTVVDMHVALFCHEEDARAQQSEESLLHGRMFVLQSCGKGFAVESEVVQPAHQCAEKFMLRHLFQCYAGIFILYLFHSVVSCSHG